MKNLVALFLRFAGILFVGFCLANTFGILINCCFDGFDLFVKQLAELPYLMYLAFSLILSFALALVIYIKTK